MSDLIEQLEDARGELPGWAANLMSQSIERIKKLEAELAKIADFVEPHWRGAGAKLEAEWIIKWISNVGTELDQAEKAEIEAIERCVTVALEQRCERDTPWDMACLAIAKAIRALKPS